MILLLALAFAAPPDRLAVAARLLADGHADRATDVLAEVEPRKADLGRYHALAGLAAFASGDAEEAVEHLTAAVQHEVPVSARLTLAAAHDQLGQPTRALAALTHPDVDALPAAWTLRARAHAALQAHDDAFAALEQGRRLFPRDRALVTETLRQQLALGLLHAVVAEAPAALAAVDADEAAWLTVLDGLIDASPGDAISFGEELLLHHPSSTRARVGLGRAHLALEQPALAGLWLAQAAAFDATYAVQAAECFRRSGDLDRAFYLNSTVVDPREKARQRLGLLLEAEQFAAAASLDPRLVRLGLLDDESVAYALAYASARVGETARAEQLVTRLTEPQLVRQGTALLESL